jgi:WD40 repeat protein
VAAIVVGVLALAAIPVALLGHRGPTTAAHAAGDPTASTDVTPIRMIVVHSTDGPPNPSGSIQLQGQTGPVQSLVFSADQSLMAGTDRGGSAHIWNSAGTLLATVTPATGLRIASVAFSPKAQQFVTVSSDGSVHFWPLPAPS